MPSSSTPSAPAPSLPSVVLSPVGNVPTNLSVNATNHTVAVVNYQDQSITVLPIPGAPVAPGTPFTLDISGALQGQVTPAPLPYSIGVDPSTNMASRGLFLDLRFVRGQSRVPRELEYRNQSLRMFDFRCHGSLPLCSGHSKHGGLPASRYGP